jgi:hypothetical protein
MTSRKVLACSELLSERGPWSTLPLLRIGDRRRVDSLVRAPSCRPADSRPRKTAAGIMVHAPAIWAYRADDDCTAIWSPKITAAGATSPSVWSIPVLGRCFGNIAAAPAPAPPPFLGPARLRCRYDRRRTCHRQRGSIERARQKSATRYRYFRVLGRVVPHCRLQRVLPVAVSPRTPQAALQTLRQRRPVSDITRAVMGRSAGDGIFSP